MPDFRFARLADPSHVLPVPRRGRFAPAGQIVDLDDGELGAFWRALISDGSLIFDADKTEHVARTLAGARSHPERMQLLDGLHQHFAGPASDAVDHSV